MQNAEGGLVFVSDQQAPVSVLWLSVKQVDCPLMVSIQLWLLPCSFMVIKRIVSVKFILFIFFRAIWGLSAFEKDQNRTPRW